MSTRRRMPIAWGQYPAKRNRTCGKCKVRLKQRPIFVAYTMAGQLNRLGTYFAGCIC